MEYWTNIPNIGSSLLLYWRYEHRFIRPSRTPFLYGVAKMRVRVTPRVRVRMRVRVRVGVRVGARVRVRVTVKKAYCH